MSDATGRKKQLDTDRAGLSDLDAGQAEGSLSATSELTRRELVEWSAPGSVDT